MNKISPKTLEQLIALVKRIEKNRKYMAWILASYQRQEKISDNKLLERLQISHEALLRLALCLSPDTESLEFHAQVAQIASYCNIDYSIIINVIRQVESLDALSSEPSIDTNNDHIIETSGLFAAARDNEITDSDPISPADNPQNTDENDNVAE